MVFILLHSLLSVGFVCGIGESELGPSGKAEKNRFSRPFAFDGRFRAKSSNTVELSRLRLKSWFLFLKARAGCG